jgi:hypothetical protein
MPNSVAKRLKRILTWGRESSRQVQDLKILQIRNIISKTAFLEGMKKLKKRAIKCINLGGMYFEK